MDPDEAFLTQRRLGLEAYLERVLKSVGPGDVGFWHHPIVMTFLDVPLPGLQLDPRITTVGTWDRELAAARDQLDKALATNRTRIAVVQHGADALTYVKSLRRHMAGAQKKLGALEAGLHAFHDHADDHRRRALALQQLRNDLQFLLEQVHGLAAGADPAPASPLASPRLAPRPHLPDDISDLLRHQAETPPEPAPTPAPTAAEHLQQQQAIMAQQDTHLASIAELASHSKTMAAAILSEVDEQNRLLDALAGKTDEAKAKLDVGQRKVKRI